MNNDNAGRGVSHEVVSLVLSEFRNQQQTMLEAEISLASCRFWVERNRNPTGSQRKALQEAEIEFESIKASLWPKSTLTMLAKLADAVEDELSAQSLCCMGTVPQSRSDRKRAASISRDESTYRSKWRLTYEWIYRRVKESVGTGY